MTRLAFAGKFGKDFVPAASPIIEASAVAPNPCADVLRNVRRLAAFWREFSISKGFGESLQILAKSPIIKPLRPLGIAHYSPVMEGKDLFGGR
jgi:hypothetical protein